MSTKYKYGTSVNYILYLVEGCNYTVDKLIINTEHTVDSCKYIMPIYLLAKSVIKKFQARWRH